MSTTPDSKPPSPPPGTELTDAQKREHLAKLVGGFDTAMLITSAVNGTLRGRPLSIVHAHEDERLYFSTAIDSGKVTELDHDPQVVVCLQDKRRFVSISGTAHVECDRALIDRLWSESWRIWFPQGKDDPELCVLVVEPHDAEYWDLTGAAGARYLFESAKAYLTGKRPREDDERQHAKVRL